MAKLIILGPLLDGLDSQRQSVTESKQKKKQQTIVLDRLRIFAR